MKKNLVLKGSPAEIVKQLEIMRAIFGKGATLDDVEHGIKFINIMVTIKKQLNEK